MVASLSPWCRRSVLLGLSLLAPSACVSSPANPAPRPLARDACSERLHEVSGLVLAHYARHKRWPTSFDDLGAGAGAGTELKFNCPVSGKPYVFDTEGLVLPSMAGRVIIYDAANSHGSYGWGILVSPPGPGQPIVARVIALSSER